MDLPIEKPKLALLSWAFVLTLAACSDQASKVETETHFLQACSSSCAAGLSCICGVCTQACADDGFCGALSGPASCAATPAACGASEARACDVTCDDRDGCSALGASFDCVDGRCRAIGGADGGGSGGTSGSGGQSGDASSGQGGAGGGNDGSVTEDAGGTDAGGDSAVVDSDCNAAGEACCDPFPQDGPNYCDGGGRLKCGANNTCEADCECALGAYLPACGVDGQTYDATCGDACVPVAIACRSECPCETGSCTVPCTGAMPEQDAVDACQAITDMAACTTYETGSFPSNCRWITPSTTMCPPLP